MSDKKEALGLFEKVFEHMGSHLYRSGDNSSNLTPNVFQTIASIEYARS